jgi:predicted O-methyltransferase YrrM
MRNFEEIEIQVPQDDSAELGEKLFLYGLIRAIKPELVVETGTHRGKTTLYMAEALLDNQKGRLITYDPFDTWDQKGNFRKFPEHEKIITFRKAEGKTCQEENIDLFFCDGYHDKQTVIEEVSAILPRLSPNAIVIFHDCAYPSNEACDVNGAIEALGLKTIWIPSHNKMRIYEHGNT